MTSSWWAELAWLGRPARRVLIEVDGETIVAVREDVDPPSGATRLPGAVLPGFANVHSHAFHRALRTGVGDAGGDFWSWREAMYAVGERLDPESYLELARAVYAEMVLAGITAVGEFHYLHHRPDGTPYDDPNAMGIALLEAALEAGIRITLLDACYLRGGFDRPLADAQRRFGDGTAGRWAERVSALPGLPHARVGAAIHSVRAVDPASMDVVARWAADRRAPLHVHASERPEENAACLAATGKSPVRLLADAGALGRRTTAIHVTHPLPGDVGLLAASGTTVCLCPTTERELGDGVGPASMLAAAGISLCLGTDAHPMIDLFDEARLVELHQRLVDGRRGHHTSAALLEAATATGMAALGWRAGRLQPGHLADLVAVSLDSPRLAGIRPERLADHLVFAATASDVSDVVVRGEPVVVAGHHVALGDVTGALERALRRLGC